MAVAVADGGRLEVSHSRRALPLGALVEYQGVRGHVRFVGRTDFAPGLFVGVELNKPYGDNNGTVDRIQYFVCRERYGVMVKPSEVRRVDIKRYKKRAIVRHSQSGTKAVESVDIPPKIQRGLRKAEAERRRERRARKRRERQYAPQIRYYDIPPVPAPESPQELIQTYSPEYRRRLERTIQMRDASRSGGLDDASGSWGEGGSEAGEAFPLRSKHRLPVLHAKYDRSLQPCKFLWAIRWRPTRRGCCSSTRVRSSMLGTWSSSAGCGSGWSSPKRCRRASSSCPTLSALTTGAGTERFTLRPSR
ncbi:uncharacterized protein AMSG_06062 [Thecamonas trahens ATCC 50062]|uniref:CAP-Gly domain-containing protein n=1 Tax=Thecamonas trahens ATCC 50062 TaxID=461836 RepID=A0A0L0DBR2_THETB|nr:hypothetical protein AMSG_06062 [Thecamonas trahens ATCC 50062]KNC49784.1 hypothetical protein AMSG_06062 [Thecamonas trahens ATCC 50062]|eukprot:XP_013757568.1 hypothetical protein AMSG_06062 [Thecamonas trahens ATCC 50062]